MGTGWKGCSSTVPYKALSDLSSWSIVSSPQPYFSPQSFSPLSPPPPPRSYSWFSASLTDQCF